MNKSGKPVNPRREKLDRAIRDSGVVLPAVDLNDTETAFAHMSDQELKKAAWLFGLMNKHWLVGIGSKIGIAAIRMHLPFVEGIVKNTIFQQFCGGTTLLESSDTIFRLQAAGVSTILDYGAEAKQQEVDFNYTMNETIRAIEFASQHDSIPMVSTKITGMARFELLEAVQRGDALDPGQQAEYQHVLKRLDSIAHAAGQKGVSLLFDAEESWIQDAIDGFVELLMGRYNKDRAVVYGTFQLYRTDQLAALQAWHQRALGEGYILGAKLVRGAYLEKERERAEELNYPSPLHVNKKATDESFDSAIRYCVDHIETIAAIVASHNAQSNLLAGKLMDQQSIPRDHPHLFFGQLFGMSDNLTFNLAKAGYRAAKLVPYGPVKDVVPYLIRRAQENTSVTGDMSREYQLVLTELKRRGLN